MDWSAASTLVFTDLNVFKFGVSVKIDINRTASNIFEEFRPYAS